MRLHEPTLLATTAVAAALAAVMPAPGAVPEPASLMLVLSGLLALTVVLRDDV